MPYMPVPGSEVFSSRIRSREQIQQSIPDTLVLHHANPDEVEHLDALSYEVIRHRLWAITDLMGQALKNYAPSSGSPPKICHP